ncbi:MAG TPA: DUF4402 domain-containing protein [Holophagaceae bacterium]|nr:DUF4402 domain-containing protein [Holophagaceae bacterium]
MNRLLQAALFCLASGLPLLGQNYTVLVQKNINLGTVNGSSVAGAVSIDVAGTRTVTGGVSLGSATGVTQGQVLVTNTNASGNNLAFNCASPTLTTAFTGGLSAGTVWPVTPTTANLPLVGNSATFFRGATVNIPANAIPGTYTATFSAFVARNGNCASQVVNYTFTISVTVVNDTITITGVSGLDFGKLISGATSGTLTLSPAGATSASGGVTTFGGLASACVLTISGGANRNYTITLPANGAVTATGPGPAMGVNNFLSAPSGTGNLGAGGSQNLLIGATLSVAANQTDGSYSGSFDVTVSLQ